MQLLCSIQYRVVKENADDAFYELQNPQEQIQAYVFDGNSLGFIFPMYFRSFKTPKRKVLFDGIALF